jgi:hypothetical protein
VTYSQSAARVLELIERLKYRLNSREEMIEQLRRHQNITGTVPSIEALESTLEDISLDQVATHFDSYQGYLQAAFGWDIDTAAISSEVSRSYRIYQDKHGVAPSPKALSLEFQYKTLPWFTTAEIARLIAGLTPTQLLDSITHGRLGAAEPEPIAAQAEPVVQAAASPVLTEDQAKIELLAKYRGVVSSRADLLALPKEQLDQITAVFRSTSVFLVRLRG